MAHLESPIPALPRQLGVPAGVERVLRRLLAKRVEDRYSSAQELEAVREAVRRAEDPRRTRPWVLRLASLAALIAVLAVPAVIATLARPDRGRSTPPPRPSRSR